MFESADVLNALFGASPPRDLENAFDELADEIQRHLDTDYIVELTGVG
jgi:hypothetical protein